jgi:hypothetical protein
MSEEPSQLGMSAIATRRIASLSLVTPVKEARAGMALRSAMPRKLALDPAHPGRVDR